MLGREKIKRLVSELPEGAQEIIEHKGSIFYECKGIIYKKTESAQGHQFQIVTK